MAHKTSRKETYSSTFHLVETIAQKSKDINGTVVILELRPCINFRVNHFAIFTLLYSTGKRVTTPFVTGSTEKETKREPTRYCSEAIGKQLRCSNNYCSGLDTSINLSCVLLIYLHPLWLRQTVRSSLLEKRSLMRS